MEQVLCYVAVVYLFVGYAVISGAFKKDCYNKLYNENPAGANLWLASQEFTE